MAIANYREQYARYKRYFTRLGEEYMKREEVKTSLEFLLTLLAISFFAIFALRPTVNAISGLISQIRSQEEIREKLETKIRSLTQAQEIWTREEKRISVLDNALPENPKPAEFIKQIEGLGGMSGVSLTSLTISETPVLGEKSDKENKKEEKRENSMESSFVVTGSYSSLVNFLEELEKTRRLVSIKDVSLVKAKIGETVSLMLTTTVNASYFKND